MKIAIVTRLFTKRNMYVVACHLSCFIVYLFVCNNLQSQHILQLSIESQDNQWKTIRSEPSQEYDDAADVLDTLDTFISDLHLNGYVFASVDTLIQTLESSTAKVFIGTQYRELQLDYSSLNLGVQKTMRLQSKRRQTIQIEDWQLLRKQIIDEYAQIGFPFARLALRNIQIENDIIQAEVHVESKLAIVFRGVDIIGEGKIGRKFLQAYLDIKPDQLYNQKRIQNIPQKLRDLEWLNYKRQPSIFFVDDGATVNVFIDRKPASRFDILLGLLPSSDSNGGKLLITGQALIDLRSPFGTGKEIKVEWQQLRPGTQRLDAFFKYPFIAGLPFGADAMLHIHKRDTSFLDLRREIGVDYTLGPGQEIRAFWQFNSSALLTINEPQIIANQKLPSTLDYRQNRFGLQYTFTRLDNRILPTNGWYLQATGGGGLRKIRRNPSITTINDGSSFNYESLYDTVRTSTTQYDLGVEISRFNRIGQLHVILARIRARTILTADPIYINEQFRVGGTRQLRGFDEENIFASSYAISTLEYRLLTGQTSYLFTFADVGYIIDKSISTNRTDVPVGFGAGLSFGTSVGNFSISYALGRQQNNPIDPRAGKIHFGYINVF